jgi:hypothetical protein
LEAKHTHEEGTTTIQSARKTNNAPALARDQHLPTITLHIANYRALSRPILDGTRARIETVYEAIGVQTVWIEGEDTSNQPPDGRLHLTVALLSNDLATKISPGHLQEHVLGLSHIPTRRVYVFCDRIAAVPGNRTMFPVSLGNIIAHEIGHFFLGHGHSRNGIMRAMVDVHAQHLQNFDETQARTIRSRLRELALSVWSGDDAVSP